MDAHLNFALTPADMSPASAPSQGRGLRLHLGVCGSVAAYRAPDLLREWINAGFSVSATLTPAAQKFIAPLTFASLGAEPVYTQPFDDNAVSPFGHLEPGQTCRAMVVAPASAATLSRIAHGQADELLACQVLAHSGPLVLAPAMNPAMWHNPATQANVAVLRERGAVIVEPGWGHTACGDMGQGRLADLREIVLAGIRAAVPQDLAGRTVLVTLGPTREVWDGVRFWTNPSTGTMGGAVCVALWLRGATVHAVCGPGCPWLPSHEGMIRHNCISAKDMFAQARDIWQSADAGVFTAAVADFSPVPLGAAKFKKSTAPEGFEVRFEPNPDILKTLAHERRAVRPQRVIGFAAETDDLSKAVRDKLHSKKADLIVGNLVAHGFGTERDTVTVFDTHGTETQWADLPKPSIAWRLASWLSAN